MKILFAGHAGYGGAAFKRLQEHPGVEIVGLIHARHNRLYTLQKTLKRRFGNLKRARKNIAKIVSNIPKFRQQSFHHPHSFDNIDPEPLARASGIPCFDASMLHDATFLDAIKKLDPDILLVVTFGELIPESILNVPKVAAVNMHPGPLPKYRGGFPELASMLNNESKIAITYHMMAATFDTGKILSQHWLEIGDRDLLQLKQAMIELTTQTVAAVVDDIESLMRNAVEQDHSKKSWCKYPKGFDVVDHEMSAEQVVRKIRASAGENYEVHSVEEGRKVYLLELGEDENAGYWYATRDGGVRVKTIRKGRQILRPSN